MFALQNASEFSFDQLNGYSKIDLSFNGSQMIEGYPVVDLRKNKSVSLKTVLDEIQYMSKGITFLYVDTDMSPYLKDLEDLKKIGKCLKYEGRDYVVYHQYNDAEMEISNSITEVEMKKWLRDPQDKDLVTTMSTARGWEASTVVLITNEDHTTVDLGNHIMRAVTKGRRVKKGFTILSSKLKMEYMF